MAVLEKNINGLPIQEDEQEIELQPFDYEKIKRTALHNHVIENDEEFDRLIQERVVSRGFEGCDAELGNEDITNFIRDVFVGILRPEDLICVEKDDLLMLNIDVNDKRQKNIMSIASRSGYLIEEYDENYHNMHHLAYDQGVPVFADSLTKYQLVESALEGCENKEDIKNTYNTLATNLDLRLPLSCPVLFIKVHSFEARKNSDLDILADTSGLSEIQKRRLYYLGIIAHEMGHIIDHLLPDDIKKEFAKTFNNNPVSPYVRKHIENYGSSIGTIISEDFAECIK
ncbi:MAG: hypothetical protein WCP03_01105, partial [Candidatus Saccharibacteria bacterium]